MTPVHRFRSCEVKSLETNPSLRRFNKLVTCWMAFFYIYFGWTTSLKVIHGSINANKELLFLRVYDNDMTYIPLSLSVDDASVCKWNMKVILDFEAFIFINIHGYNAFISPNTILFKCLNTCLWIWIIFTVHHTHTDKIMQSYIWQLLRCHKM